MKNVHRATVDGFGEEWSRFDQSALSDAESRQMFEEYFRIFPWSALATDAIGFDVGCGSGRWARLVAPRVGTLHCIDASDAALNVARTNLKGISNVSFHHASLADIPLADGSMDFGYSLGVLHHVPDTREGLRACVAKLKPGAPFLVYLYYAFDNRPAWFRGVWRASDALRRVISRLPSGARHAVAEVIAGAVYLPLARGAAGLEGLGFNVSTVPLSSYRNRSFYSMRTDALDRFGTRLEQRFTAVEVKAMMEDAGLTRVVVGDSVPFWTAVGVKA